MADILWQRAKDLNGSPFGLCFNQGQRGVPLEASRMLCQAGFEDNFDAYENCMAF